MREGGKSRGNLTSIPRDRREPEGRRRPRGRAERIATSRCAHRNEFAMPVVEGAGESSSVFANVTKCGTTVTTRDSRNIGQIPKFLDRTNERQMEQTFRPIFSSPKEGAADEP